MDDKTKTTENKNNWHIVKLPAIADIDDPIQRLPGEALWEERFSIERLKEIRRVLGSYWFSALYQQSPAPSEGGIFKKHTFRYFNIEHEYYILKKASKESLKYLQCDCIKYACCDLAARKTETSDYTVILVFAICPKKEILILDIIRERFEGADHLNIIQNVYDIYNPCIIGIESVQYQIALIQMALRQGLPIKELKPEHDKVSRALGIAARLESGTVFFLSNANWLNTFENELLLFPSAKHDDQVDAFAYISQLIQPISNTMPSSSSNKYKSSNKCNTKF